MLFTAYEYIIVSATMFEHFQNGRHEPELIIYHHLRRSSGPRKELFLASAHDKSDGMYANSVRQLVTHEIKGDCLPPSLWGTCIRLYW